jgi:hypothetical protein
MNFVFNMARAGGLIPYVTSIAENTYNVSFKVIHVRALTKKFAQCNKQMT